MAKILVRSQSPQTGQFNSYIESFNRTFANSATCLNPLKRVNSILTYGREKAWCTELGTESQSPQTGQFNSYMKKNLSKGLKRYY